MIDRLRLYEIIRYVLSGLLATHVHYCAFIFIHNYIFPQSAGGVNFVASFLGIVVSFLGSRYFVFRSFHASIVRQFTQFGILYLVIALVSGFTLFIWSDYLGYNKTIGFLIGVIIQVCCSYLGGRRVVFA